MPLMGTNENFIKSRDRCFGTIIRGLKASELYTTFSMSGNASESNLMFSGEIDVVLEYRTVPAIINDSLSKRTMKVVNMIIRKFGKF